MTVRCGRYIHHQATTTTATTTTTVLTTSSTTTTTSSTAALTAGTTTTAATNTFIDSPSTRSRRAHSNNTQQPHSSPQTSHKSLRYPAKKSSSGWPRHYKSGSISKFIGRHDGRQTSTKLHRLALKSATFSDLAVNGINKPDYKDLVRSEARQQASARSAYWKSVHDGVVDYKLNISAVAAAGDRYETSTEAAALNNVTYSETVHDSTEMLLGDGQTTVFGVTEESTVGTKRQETPKTETETNDGSVANASMANENSTKVDISPKRHFEVESNAIPTFPRVESTVRTAQKPERRADKSEKVYRLAKEGGPRISRNEIHSKVGRDPPFWVPVEPLPTEPFLREPNEKHIEFEEPYEPIPPLAKNDIGNQNWIPDSKTEPSVTSPVNVTVRQRPEAKEGGTSQLRKIASPLEQEWLRKAQVKDMISDTQRNSDGGLHRNITTTTGQPADLTPTAVSRFSVNNHTERKLQRDHDDVQTDDRKLRVNPAVNDCATTSWKNVQLVQDTLNGGFYVIQRQVRGNCSKERAPHPDKGREQIGINEFATLKPEKHDLSRSTVEQPRGVETSHSDDDSTSPEKVLEAGWMFFDQDGNLAKGTHHHQDKDPGDVKLGDLSSTKDVSQDLVNATDHQIQTSPVNEFAEDLVRHRLIKQHPEVEKVQERDSAMKEETMSLTAGYLLDKEQTDVTSERKVLPESSRQTPAGAVPWPPFPISSQESNADDLIESGFRVVGQTQLGRHQDDGTRKSLEDSAELHQGHTTPETLREVHVPAAFHADTAGHTASISRQSITWGKRCEEYQ